MRLLLDTHILLWTIADSGRLSAAARALIGEPGNELSFSAASLWEIAIKSGQGREDFRIDVGSLRRSLFDNDYEELPMTGAHAAALGNLPPIHRDPFDRLLVAHAIVERLTLVTSDRVVAKYPGPIQLV
jgi:PIN domain nuclease of toxin-antitoxin system